MTLATQPTGMADDLTITVSDRVSDDARADIMTGLEAVSLDLVGPFDPEPLAVLLRDGDGRLTGGLLGRSFWGWLVIETFPTPGNEVGRTVYTWRPLVHDLDAEARQSVEFIHQYLA